MTVKLLHRKNNMLVHIRFQRLEQLKFSKHKLLYRVLGAFVKGYDIRGRRLV
jgi:hypothetical protein